MTGTPGEGPDDGAEPWWSSTSWTGWPEGDARWDDATLVAPVDPSPPRPVLRPPAPPRRWPRRALAVGVTVAAGVVAATAARAISTGTSAEALCVPRTTERSQLVFLDPPGCRRAVRYDRDRAVMRTPDGARLRVGEPGDWLLVGDWDCDGRSTAALYRPADGTLFLFDRWASDGRVESRAPVPSGTRNGRPAVEHRDGCDAITVRAGRAVSR